MEAYSSQYNPHINEDGWFDMTYIETVPHLEEKLLDHVSYDVKGGLIRPKSLQGIENNNGWIKIESEEDLPKDSAYYWIVTNSKNIHLTEYEVDFKQFFTKDYAYNDYEITHYQQIDKPKSPIY